MTMSALNIRARRLLAALALLPSLASAHEFVAHPAPGRASASSTVAVPARPVASRALELPPGHFVALSFHEVDADLLRADPGGSGRYATDPDALVKKFQWLRANGWTPVSLQDILDARAGLRPLPPKAVLLSFDDGYADVHTRVFPLLKLFNYPALIAVVGSWMDAPEGGSVDYDGRAIPRSRFLTWEQVREMRRSGLVEVASHSHDLHRGIPANPQGNNQPATTTRLYDKVTGRREDDDAWARRIRDDLSRSAARIERETGARPRAIVWPYGRYNGAAAAIARELGMTVGFTLNEGSNGPDQPLDHLNRGILEFNPDLTGFVAGLVQPYAPDPQRVVHVDLDYIHDPDPAAVERNLSALVDRMAALKPGTVYLQAYADPDGDGEADALYFPSRHLPMRADLFNRVAWQLQTRAGVRVLAWMPVLAFRLPDGHPAATETVRAVDGRPGSSYHRLSPFSAKARETIAGIYEDLARASYFAGLLFHDDALLGDREDAHPEAIARYREWGLVPAGVPDGQAIAHILADPARAAEWSRRKTAWLVDFTLMLRDRVLAHRAPLVTARNLYARPVLEPASEAWYAQSLPAFLAAYDWVPVMAMPYMEGAKDPDAFLADLLGRVAAVPDGLTRTVFELQAKDWRRGRPVPGERLAGWMRRLERQGARHLGYYPDDVFNDHPPLRTIAPAFSLRAQPEPVRR